MGSRKYSIVPSRSPRVSTIRESPELIYEEIPSPERAPRLSPIRLIDLSRYERGSPSPVRATEPLPAAAQEALDDAEAAILEGEFPNLDRNTALRVSRIIRDVEAPEQAVVPEDAAAASYVPAPMILDEEEYDVLEAMQPE